MSPAGRSRGTAASCLSRRHRKEKRTRRPARSIAYALDAGRGRAPLEGLLHELRRCLICPYLRISFAYVDRRETGMPGGDTTPASGVRRAQPGIVLPRLCPRCGVILPPWLTGPVRAKHLPMYAPYRLSLLPPPPFRKRSGLATNYSAAGELAHDRPLVPRRSMPH
jgi:hypothetical protein